MAPIGGFETFSNLFLPYFRFCFARSEVQLKKLVPAPFMKVFYCWRSVLGRALSRQRQVLRPYALRAIFFWACDRVKVSPQ